MDVLNIDWKNIDSRFVRDEFYEDIRAPKWLDFLALEEPVDDDAWFCKPDCNHPRTAASLLDAPLFESPKVRQPRSVRSTSTASISSIMPLGDRTASVLNRKKTGGPLSTSVTSLYELKAKENASRNLKKPSPADRSKHASRIGKYLPDAENDNPNRPRSVSSVSSMGKNPKSSTPSSSGKSPKLQGSKNVSISPAKISKQYIAAKDSQSPLSMEKRGVAKQAIGNLSTSSNSTPVAAPASSEKKGAKKQVVYNNTTPVKTPESSEKKGAKSPTRITKLTSNKSPTSDNQSSSLKSGSAIKGTFSAGNLFGKTPRKDFLTHLSEFCSEVKKLALYGGQKDSAKQSNMAFKHDSNVGSEEKCIQNQDDKINSLYEFSYERSSLSGSMDQQVMKNSIIGDPDKCSKSGPMEIGGLRLRNNKKDCARSCPNSGVKDNLSSFKQPKLDEEDFSSHTENMVRDTSGNMLTNLSTLHEDEHDELEKVEKIKDSSDPFLELFSGPIHSHEQENTAHSVDPQLEKYKESSEHLDKGFMEPHKKSFHKKIFSPSSWKKKRTDGVEQRVHPTNKYSWNAGQKPKEVKKPRYVRSTSTASISSTMPLGDRTASTLNCKKIWGPPSTSKTIKNTATVTVPASSEKKGTKKQTIYNTTTPVKTPETSEKKGARSPTRITKLTSNKNSTSDNRSSSLKSGPTIKGTLSSGNLLGKTPRKDFLTNLSSGLKKLALCEGQGDSTKQSKMAFKHDSNVGSEEKGKQTQDDKINCLCEFSYERSSLSGSKDQQVMKNSIIDDPDKCNKSGPTEIGELRLRKNTKGVAKSCPKSGLRLTNNKKDAAKSCPKSGVKEDNLSSFKQPKLNKEGFSSHTENMLRDTLGNTLTNLSTIHEHGDDDFEKVEKIKDSSDPFLELFSGPVHSHEQENTANSVDTQLEKYEGSSEHLQKGFMEPDKKSFHAKIFSPSSWKKKRTDGVEQRVHPTNKYSWNAGQKVQSCPPSPQQVCRLSQTSSSSSQGRKSTTTPMQPFRLRTSERGALREYRKLQRSSSCADNVVASPEPKLYMPDVFWFLKRCA